MNPNEKPTTLLSTIGNTPIIPLDRFFHNSPVRVYAKIESYNPGHSMKDRVARHVIEEAEKEGLLKPGSTIVETTSGNTGYSLAMICAVKATNASWPSIPNAPRKNSRYCGQWERKYTYALPT